MLLAQLVERARALSGAGERRILGVTGPPGSGKTALAGLLGEALAPQAVVVPMDGFHLANAELVRLGRRDRKGAPDTFDAGGYVALLRRLREPVGDVLYAPEFDRDLEEAVAGSIAVGADVSLVITEGNYLLLEEGQWSSVHALLDDVWYLDGDDDVRVGRLIARHVRHGKPPSEARAWATGTDARNAVRIAATRHLADLVVTLPDLGRPV